MKPNFALHLDLKGITLLHRAKQGWHRTGEVSFDDPDWSEKLGFLQKTATALAPNGITTKLLLPDSQVLYTSVTAPGPDPEARRARIAEALDGLTPYRIDELVFDWYDSGEAGIVRVAAVARETLDEAEAFARQRGFNPLYFAARPPEERFPLEPFFGATAMAATLLPEGETLERDTEPTRESPPARAVPHAVPPRDQPPGSLDTLLTLSDRLRAHRAQGGAQASDQERISPARTAIGSDCRSESETAAVRLATNPTAKHKTSLGPVLPAAAGIATGPLTAVREDPAESPPSAPAVSGPSLSRPEAAHAVALITMAWKLAPRHRRRDVPPGLVMLLVLAIAILVSTLWLTVLATPDAGSGSRQTARQEAPPPIAAPDTQTGFVTQGHHEAQTRPAPTIRTARQTAGRTPKPESLMAPAPPGDAPPSAIATSPELAGRSRAAETLPPVREHEPIPPETAARTAQPTPALGSPGLAGHAGTDAGTQEGMAEGGATAPLSRQDAERLYTATGIWLRGPAPLPQPPRGGQADGTYIASIDPAIPTPDAVALPPLGPTPGDLSLPRIAPPVSPGSRFTLDGRGLVTPSPEGTETPDGIRVHAGAPPARPPARPTSAMPALAANPDLAGLRPRHRPADLREIGEKATLGGRTRAELSAIRPRPRPAASQNAPGVNEAPTAQAVAASLKPAHRPGDFAKTVAVIRAAASSPPATPATVPGRNDTQADATAPRNQTAVPRLPTRASVARQATVANAINLHRINLIGIYGSASKRHALVRLRNGRYVKVAVGDRLNGGKVVAIGENSLRYVKGRRNIVLQMPKT